MPFARNVDPHPHPLEEFNNCIRHKMFVLDQFGYNFSFRDYWHVSELPTALTERSQCVTEGRGLVPLLATYVQVTSQIALLLSQQDQNPLGNGGLPRVPKEGELGRSTNEERRNVGLQFMCS